MPNQFIELKTTDGQLVQIRREAISAYEVVPGSVRVAGHIKVYVPGFKFLIASELEDFLKALNKASS